MIDKVRLRLQGEHLPLDFDKKLSITNNIYVSDKYVKEDGRCGGRYRGKNVCANDGYIRFEGSLPKCLYGNNIHVLSLLQIREVIETMSKELCVPMEDAEVELLEFSANLVVSRPPIEYMMRMGWSKGMVYSNIMGSPYLKGKDVDVKMYDKIKEAKDKRMISRRERQMIAPNQLRYEVTFKKGMLLDMFDRVLTAKDLWDKKVFWRLVSEWLKIYENIEKKSDSAFDIRFEDLKGCKDLYYWAVCLLNEQLDVSCFLKSVLFKNRDSPQYQDSSRHHALQSALAKSKQWGKEHIKPSGLVEELDACIEQYLTQLLEVSPDGLTEEEERLLFS